MTGSSLLEREASDTIAVDQNGAVSVSAFLARVNQIATQLPDTPYAVNLCRDRIRFITAFAAVIAAGQCNLLPPNRQQASVANIMARYPGCYVIHDGHDVPEQVPHIDITELLSHSGGVGVGVGVGGNGASADTRIPQINDEQLGAISFTSGSTGEPQPNLKYWSTLRDSSHINRRYMVEAFDQPKSMLATVPPQHMWGLETSVLLPMFANITVHTGQPLYPLDVSRALAQLSAPRVLVSTPAHLRALFDGDLEYPAVQTVLSATAPLAPQLAQQSETILNAKLIEIYGCSEGGSLAFKRTATETDWQAFDAMRIEFSDGQSGDGRFTLHADHLPQAVELQDNIVFTDNGRFQLQGRQGDLINVAGKRGSLAELNRHLLNIDGVIDGVIFEPPTTTDAGDTHQRRLAALVVAPQLDAKAIHAGLLDYVDPVFIPRPIVFVPVLPRSESSKLTRQAVLELFAKSRTRIS